MPKKNVDLQTKLKKRKFKKAFPPFYFIYYIVGLTPLLGGKYHPHYVKKDKIKKGPAFVIFNHLSRRDHTFVISACGLKRVNMVAAYNEFFRKHLHFAFWGAQILPKKVFDTDLAGMRAINSIIHQNGIVTFSPEGTSSLYGTNQPIAPGTGKYLKSYKIPVYFCNIKGSYLTNNKVSGFSDRIGKVEVTLSLLFSKEDLERLSGDEIQEKIDEVFTHDDYLWNKEKHIEYKGKGSMTERLQDMCYRCPRCGKLFTMEEYFDHLKCHNCGYDIKLDHFYNMTSNDPNINFESPSKWAEWEREQVIKEIRDPNFSFEMECELGNLPKNRWVPKERTSVPCGKGIMRVDHNGFHFIGIKNNEPFEIHLNYYQIFTFSISVDLRMLSIYRNDEYFDFIPYENKACYFLMCVEEMHRYHVNIWKNLKKYDYMYEGYELGIDNKNK